MERKRKMEEKNARKWVNIWNIKMPFLVNDKIKSNHWLEQRKFSTWTVILREAGAHSSAISLSNDTKSANGGTLISNPASAFDGCTFITKPCHVTKREHHHHHHPYASSSKWLASITLHIFEWDFINVSFICLSIPLS